MSRKSCISRLALLATLGLASAAAAQEYAPTTTAPPPEMSVTRRSQFAGKNELSAQTGFQGSLGGTTPGGFKLLFDYSRRMTDRVWLNFKVDPTFAVGEIRGTCYDGLGRAYDCGVSGLSGNGHAIDFLAGIKLKFPVARLRLMPYANVNAGLVGIFSRPQGDDGVAVVARTGGGLKYFVTPRVAVGGELQLTLGPAFYSDTCPGCNNAHNELYRAIDLAVGAEFIL